MARAVRSRRSTSCRRSSPREPTVASPTTPPSVGPASYCRERPRSRGARTTCAWPMSSTTPCRPPSPSSRSTTRTTRPPSPGRRRRIKTSSGRRATCRTRKATTTHRCVSRPSGGIGRRRTSITSIAARKHRRRLMVIARRFTGERGPLRATTHARTPPSTSTSARTESLPRHRRPSRPSWGRARFTLVAAPLPTASTLRVRSLSGRRRPTWLKPTRQQTRARASTNAASRELAASASRRRLTTYRRATSTSRRSRRRPRSRARSFARPCT